MLGGLRPGEVVVTEGSFFLRAESLRNGPSGASMAAIKIAARLLILALPAYFAWEMLQAK